MNQCTNWPISGNSHMAGARNHRIRRVHCTRIVQYPGVTMSCQTILLRVEGGAGAALTCRSVYVCGCVCDQISHLTSAN